MSRVQAGPLQCRISLLTFHDARLTTSTTILAKDKEPDPRITMQTGLSIALRVWMVRVLPGVLQSLHETGSQTPHIRMKKDPIHYPS